MLRDRYQPMNIFDLFPDSPFTMDPVLAELDHTLDDDIVFQKVKADLAKRSPHTLTDGRPSAPVEVILRLLVVKHLYNWSYEATEFWVNDSLSLRQFCRIYLETVPDDTAMIRWANLIQPDTLHTLLDHVTLLARTLKVTRGRKLRMDGTVVETNIHHPTDSSLLTDGVRVLTRTLKKAQALLQDSTALARTVFRDRRQSARRQAKAIEDALRQRGEQADKLRQGAYRRLLAITQATVRQVQQAATALKEQGTQAATKLADRLDHMRSLVEQVITQTTKRVLQGESVSADEKLVSLFEPHTAIIRKGKIHKPTEFGRMVWLSEVEGGIVSRYDILDGNPGDSEQFKPSLDHHIAVFTKPPHLVTADRGVFSFANEEYAHAQGVKYVAIPKPGAISDERKAHEKQGWFRRGYAWRSGSEGRISLLKRRFGLDRCRYHGDAGMERWVGWGIIAHNLRVMARAAST
jgi:IS5 family transposase